MRKENKLVEESLAFVKAYMADKSNDNLWLALSIGTRLCL